MTVSAMQYENGMYRARPVRQAEQKSKREQDADLINAGRKLAREALDEENREMALDAEYGPKINRI